MKIKLPLILGAAYTGSTIVLQAAQPNFIVILVDDVGFSDFSCFGSGISTPNIDQLAKQGLRFTQMYNGARSCPTRASLLTGLYPHQTGIGHMSNNTYFEDGGEAYQGYLNNKCVTFAEVLKDNGYFTGFAGKWHLGGQTKAHTRGFTESISSSEGGVYFPENMGTKILINGVTVSRNDSRLPTNWYSTDLWTDFAIKYVNQAITLEKPFAIYLAHNAAHFPLQAPQEDINKWRGKFKKGWDALRIEKYKRQMEMNLFGKTFPLTPRNPKIPLWNSLSQEQQDKSDHIMAIYAAVIDRLDQSIGRLVNELKAKGVYDNTFIILLSDNGGNAEGGTLGTYTGTNPGDYASDIWIGHAWAELSNTPFYLYKHHTHEGGIATSCIISYPALIPEQLNGTISQQAIHILDVMPTMLELSGATYPKTYKGITIIPYEGVSMLPVLSGNDLNRQKPIFWEHENNYALREGNWKLVKEKAETDWQLYNLDKDRTEMQDVSGCNPEIKSSMLQKLNEIKNRVGAKDLSFPGNNWMFPTNKY